MAESTSPFSASLLPAATCDLMSRRKLSSACCSARSRWADSALRAWLMRQAAMGEPMAPVSSKREVAATKLASAGFRRHQPRPIDDAHAALGDFAEKLVVTETPQMHFGFRILAALPRRRSGSDFRFFRRDA